MSRLYLHRMEPVEKDGRIVLEKVPENVEQCNCGVDYKFEIKLLDSTHAKSYGWSTGYPSPCDEGPKGRVYAPKGFKKGNLAFITVDDWLLSVSKMSINSIDDFLANLEKADVAKAIDTLQGFSLIGEISYDVS